jgi:hypothetical protein
MENFILLAYRGHGTFSNKLLAFWKTKILVWGLPYRSANI